MKIVKLQNGLVQFTTTANKVYESISPEDIDLKLSNGDTVINVIQRQEVITTIIFSEVTHTKIEPNGEVAISGDIYDLVELLSESFFTPLPVCCPNTSDVVVVELSVQTNSAVPVVIYAIPLDELDVIYLDVFVQYRRQSTNGAGVIRAFGGGTRDSGAGASLLNGTLAIVQQDTITGANPILSHSVSGNNYNVTLDGNSATVTDYEILLRYSIKGF